MERSFIARLGPRQSMLLQMAVMFVVIGSLFALGEALQRADSLLTWCQNFVVAGSAKVAAVAMAVVVALAITALASLGSLLAFAVGEVASALRFSAAVRRKTVESPGRVRAVVLRARIKAPVIAVDDAAPFAVTVGLLRPRVIVSTALVSALTVSELASVLCHEDAHAAERHPLRALGWESLRRLFFFLPVLHDVTDHLSLARELQADQHAVKERGSRSLAAAMLKAATGYLSMPTMPLAVAPFGHLPSRIAALSGARGTEFRLSPLRSALTASFGSLLAVAYLFLGSAEAIAGDMVGKCELPRGNVTEYVFSTNFSLVVPQMTPAPRENMSVPVQSSPVRP